jgi:hypothetical protein
MHTPSKSGRVMLALTAFLFAASPVAGEPRDAQPTVNDMVVLFDTHPRGALIRKAKTMDLAALGPLVEMIRAVDHESNRPQAVFMLGLMGDARAVEPVVDLVLRGYQGELEDWRFGVVINGIGALGDLAGAGSDQALDFLLKHRFPATWALGWSYHDMSRESLHRLLSFITLNALGRSGRPEALAVLREMQEAEDLDQELRDAARGGLQHHATIQKLGLLAAIDPDFRPEQVKEHALIRYADVRQCLMERRADWLSEFLAENGKPVLLYDEKGQKTDRESYLLKRLADGPAGFETQRQILLDIEASEEVKRGTPMVTINDDGTAVVVIPLENSRPLVKRHFPEGISGVTVDAEGRLLIYLFRASARGGYYWNPFGW